MNVGVVLLISFEFVFLAFCVQYGMWSCRKQKKAQRLQNGRKENKDDEVDSISF